MTDRTAIILQEIGLGRFVDDQLVFDSPPRSRDVLRDSVWYLRTVWNTREAEFRINQLVDKLCEGNDD